MRYAGILITMTMIGWYGFLYGASTGPQYCGDEGTVYPNADISGPDGERDCYVDLYDFALMAGSWLHCSDPQNSGCDYLHLAALRHLNAVQTEYGSYVPHTTKRGVPLTAYSAADSFFPIIMYGAPLSSAGANDWAQLKTANFNTVAPWLLSYPATFLTQGAAANLQVIVMGAWSNSILNGIKDHANLLGNIWKEDPIKLLDTGTIETQYANFLAYKSTANGIAPAMRVFTADWFNFSNSALTWWQHWNTAGDVSCHKNYPVTAGALTLAPEPRGLPQTTMLAVNANMEAKPIWLVVGAFESTKSPTEKEAFRFPTEQQLRTQVYAGIVSGATGIAYFTWDNSSARGMNVIGIAPSPPASYIQGQPVARPEQLLQSAQLWKAVAQINAELAQLSGAILSPTSSLDYTLVITGDGVTHTPLRCMLKPNLSASNRYYLITVNVDKAVLKVVYSFPQALETVQPLFENRTAIAPEAGNLAFTDYYEPYDTHVYEITVP